MYAGRSAGHNTRTQAVTHTHAQRCLPIENNPIVAATATASRSIKLKLACAAFYTSAPHAQMPSGDGKKISHSRCCARTWKEAPNMHGSNKEEKNLPDVLSYW